MTRSAAIILQILAAIAAMAATVAPTSAHAAGLDIERAGSPDFPERAYTLHTPDRLALDPADVTVAENGANVEELTVESAAGAGGSFATVLVIDASNSMRGEPIAHAMEAARAFADRRMEDQLLGVVTFNRDANVLMPLTAEPDEIAAALDQAPPLGPSTRLNDAVRAALGMLTEREISAGSVVVLSDGADTGSEASSAEVSELASGSGVRIFPVGLRSERFAPGALRELAVGGTVADASDPEELASIFDRIGARLASEHLIRYESGAGSGQAVTVEVEVAGVPGIASAHYETPAASASATASEEAFWGSRAAMLAAVALAAAMLGLAVFAVARPRREAVRDRLMRFVGPISQSAHERSEAARASVAAEGPLSSVDRALDAREWWGQLKQNLEIAQVEISAIRLAALTAVGTGLLAVFIVQVLGVPVLIPLALLVPFGVRVWLNRRLRKERRAFADQLPDGLQLIASALRAGQSMASAFGVVVDESPDPARREFERIVNDERLGVPLEDAIRHVARRMDNRDLEQVALVATIQRETGGNTAEVLDQVIATIRERGGLRRLMETLTAQGRLTQIIISVLPIALLVAITVLNRDYMTPLFETGGGHIALGIGAALSIIGSLIIKRIVEVRV